jgi:RNA polymerase sigma-70 factor, ECF subfamily
VSPEERELLERARAGDQAAFRLLVERHEGTVAAVVNGMLGRGDEADDVGQEVFIRFYRSLHRFRGDASVRTWLTRIAMNLSRNALRGRRRRRLRFHSRDADPGPALEPTADARDEVDARETRRLVHAALDRLSPDHRAVVVLRMLEGHSTRDAARILEVPEGTVMSRLSRAMRSLESDLRLRMDER